MMVPIATWLELERTSASFAPSMLRVIAAMLIDADATVRGVALGPSTRTSWNSHSGDAISSVGSMLPSSSYAAESLSGVSKPPERSTPVERIGLLKRSTSRYSLSSGPMASWLYHAPLLRACRPPATGRCMPVSKTAMCDTLTVIEPVENSLLPAENAELRSSTDAASWREAK